MRDSVALQPRGIRGRITYANVVATLALFIALGGVGYAALKLPKNSVHSKQIAKGAVKTSDIGKGAVTQAKLGAGAVGAGQLSDGAVGNGKLADGSVTAAKIAGPDALHRVGAPGEVGFEPNNQHIWTTQFGSGTEVSFQKDQLGQVHLFGTAICAPQVSMGCTPPQAGVIYTLPPGFRPAQDLRLPVVSGTSTNPLGEIIIFRAGGGSDGEILVNLANMTAGSTTIVLDGITFPGH